MLLKNHYQPVAPQGYFDSFWPRVEQKVDGDEAAGGGDEELVFKSSPALDSLNIPQAKPKALPKATARREATSPADTPPPPPAGYRWPLAFVCAAAIVMGGVLLYKRMEPQPPQPASPAARATLGQAPAPAVAGTSADATLLAAANLDGGVDTGVPPAKKSAGGDWDEIKPTAVARPVPHAKRHRRRAAHGGAHPKSAAAEPARSAKAAKRGAKRPGKARRGKKGKKGKKDSLDTLIDEAIGGAGKTAPAKPRAKAQPKKKLPASLTMNQIRTAMRKIKGRVQACYDKYGVPGMAKVKVTIGTATRPKKVRIKGKFFGTDTGNCVIKAVKRARFPRFAGKPITIDYAFSLSD